MKERIRVLLVEDYPPDAELEEFFVRQVFPSSEFFRVQTKKDFLSALDNFKPDIIISDYSMPQFDGLTALKLTIEKSPLIPFILCTGSMNEDTAVECMKLGATDYIIKEHNKRLGEAVKNALEQAQVKKDKNLAEQQTLEANLDQAFLLTSANQFLSSNNLLDIYRIVFDLVRKLVPDSYLIVSSNNPEENTQKALFHSGFEKYLTWLDKMFHINQENLRIPITNLSKEEIERYNSGKLLLEPEGLFKLSAKTIPREICFLIEKALRIKETYYIGFTSQEQQLGIVAILKKEKGIPPKANLLEIVMGQASQAIQKLIALEINKLNHERLESLLTIAQYKPQSVQDLLDKALDEIVKLTRSKIGYIYHYFPDREEFVLNTCSKKAMSDTELKYAPTIFHLEKTGFWGEAVRQRKPVLNNQFLDPHSLKKGNPEGHVPLTKFLSIPIFNEDRIVAIASVGNKESDYTQSDINQLTIMMDSVWKMVKQKETDLLLHENEEKYKAIMNQSLDNIYLADIKSMKILEANPAICQFLGYTLDEMVNLTITDLVKATQQNIDTLIQYLLVNRKLNLGERTYQKKNQDIVQVEATASIIHYQDKEVICVISHDITDRKKTELDLFESREKLRMILNYSPIGTATIDEHGFLYGSNNSFKNLFCMPSSKEESDFNIFHPDIMTSQEKDLLMEGEVLNLERTYTFEQLESFFQCHMNRSGKIDLELTIKAVEVNPETHIKEFLLQVQDITERKKVEALKNDFINTISHEMRTPLTSIRESVSILKDHYSKDLSKEQIHLLDISQRNINRLNKLIQDVLDFQKLDTVGMKFNKKPENINNIIQQMVDDLSGTMNTGSVKLELELYSAVPLILMDKDRISQVLINLINNAFKFTKEGSITIKTEMDDTNQQVKVSVIDTGVGIRPENINKLFIPFSQIKADKDFTTGGTGLGLSISKKIMEEHGTALHVFSEYGKGSTFYFYMSPYLD